MTESTFRTFEADAANEFAMRLARAAADLDDTFSPVVLYGEAGAGKSHLLSAIAAELRRHHPGVPFLYLSERTAPEYLLAAKGEGADQGYAYRPYSGQRVLLVDDVERFGDGNGLTTRFTHLFDTFFDTGRVVVITSATEPRTLAGFSPRFLSRLSSGVAAKLGLPAYEARLRILKHEAEHRHFGVDANALEFLAQLPVHTVGQLVTLFNQVRWYCVATGQRGSLQTLEPLRQRLQAAAEAGEPVAAETWCAEWYAGQMVAVREQHTAELRKAHEALTSMETELAEQTGGTEEARSKLSRLGDALRNTQGQLEALRQEHDAVQARLASEIPRLEGLLEDKNAELKRVEDDAEERLQSLQARLAEATEAAEGAAAAARTERDQLAESHAAEVAELEQRLEQMYASLNEAQQDFAIQNQNRDKLLEKLSDDLQQAKEEAAAALAEREERAAELGDANAALAQAREALDRAREEHQQALHAADADRDTTVQERAQAFEQQLQEQRQEADARIAELERAHADALAAAQDEATLAADELRRQLDAKEGALRSITEDLQAKIGEVERANKAGEELRAERARAHEAAEAAQGRIRELEAALADHQAGIEAREQALAEAHDARARAEEALAARDAEWQAERERLHQAAQTQAQAHEALQAELTSRAEELGLLREAEAAHEAQVLDLHRQLADRDALAEAVKAEKTRSRELEGQLHSAEERIQAMQGSLEEDTARLSRHAEGLAEELKIANKHANERGEEARKAGEKLQAALAELDQTRDALTAAKREHGEATAAAAQDKHALEGALHERTTELEQVREDLAKLQQKLDAQSAALKDQETLAAQLQETVGEKERLLAEVRKDDSKELQSLKAELQSRESDMAQLRAQLKETAAAHAAALQQAHDETEAERHAAQDRARERDEARQTIQAVQLELASARETLADLETQRTEEAGRLNARIAELAEELAGSSEAQDGQRAQQEAEIQRLREAVTQAQTQTQEREARVAELQEQAEELQREIETVRDARDMADRHLAELREQHGASASELERTLAEAQERYEAETTELRAHVGELEQQLAAAAEKDATIHKLGGELEAARARVGELEIQAEAGAADAGAADARLVEQAARIQELETQLAEAHAAAAQAAEAQGDEELRGQMLEMEAQIAASERALQTLQENFASQLAESTAKAREKEVMLSSTVRELQAQLNRTQMEHDDRQSESDRLGTLVTDLQSELEQMRQESERLRDQLAAAEASAQQVRTAAPSTTAPPQTVPPQTIPPAAAAATPTVPPGARETVPPQATAPPLEVLAVPKTAELDEQLTFENFEPTGASAFSLRSARQVAQTPGDLYNPLVVYGVGAAGKTHILHALGNAIADAHTELDIVYTSLTGLVAVINAIPTQTDLDTVALEADVLLVDDFDVADLGIEQQLRLTRVLTHFVNDGRQLALACQVPPVKLARIERELVRFLEDGLLVKFDPNPDVAQRQVDDLASAMENVTDSQLGADVTAEGARESGPHAPTIPYEDAASAPEPEPAPEPAPPVRPPVDPFTELLAVNPNLLRKQYRGPKAFDEFLEAYQQPNASRKTRFPLYVADEDVDKRFHFFHALGNELQALFGGAQIALLSFIKLLDVLRTNADFDMAGLTERLLQADIVLLNDAEPVADAAPEIVAGVTDMVQTLVDAQKLMTVGLAKANKKDPIFGPVVKSGVRKKI